MKKIIVCLVFSLSALVSFAKAPVLVDRVEPLSWWSGMANTELQLMLHGSNVAQCEVSFADGAIAISRIEKTDNPNFLFVYVNTARVTPGVYRLIIKNGCKKQVVNYEFKARRDGSADRASFTSADAIYLLMPDRFANGNPANDNVKGYVQTVNRNDLGARHGGDIQGIINHLPHIAELGCTAVWPTPFFDNNDSNYSYHHYACGDYYKIDPRLGTADDYRKLSDECHKHQLKLLIDVVPNHCGAAHWWNKDVPAKDWFNRWDSYTGSNYRMTAWTDPHASEFDRTRLAKGWFAPNMPDLNLENPLLFDYLSQVYIYWIELANIDGMRVDTYPYNNIRTAARFIQRIRDEYKQMNVVGECWVKIPAEIAYYQSGNNNKDGFDSHLQSVMDFVLKDVFETAFTENESWDKGMIRFYNHYAQDFVYANPNLVMNFLDNHDINRYATVAKGDISIYKMALAMLCTTRGYPQIYYGTEIMLDGIAGNYEGHRFDFPGGWATDTRNAFEVSQRTKTEQEIFTYLKTLLDFRKQSPALQTGRMKQFIPYDGIYVYFRYDDHKTVMVVANNNKEDKQLDLARFDEMQIQGKKAIEVTTRESVELNKTILLPAKTVLVLDIQ
ncbi:MAG: alpha-amylase family glycosyl hydrolase [Paludibacteraceae bacterium]|nr:alpha-amylase family glycosyl hydrolase [Paludibacteraceae bacterium]